MMSNPPNAPIINLPKDDPRIRVTFADVAMKFVHDLPTYFGLAVVLAMATLKIIDGMHAAGIMAFIYQARSRPPESQDKFDKITRAAMPIMLVLFLISGTVTACR